MKKTFTKIGIFAVIFMSFTSCFSAKEKANAPAEKDKDGYFLVWEDNFDGKSLNKNDWNFEYHEPGWVNNELQSYGDAKENTYVKNGNLVIQALKKNGGYTSGRVNTQNKHTITYGKVEVRAKMPSGKGFLPAIWMMPNDENLYGQWPKCGEIDIAEVLGNKTSTVYGTIHFGEPHSESQGKYVPGGVDFSKDFHVYAMEWEPGVIRWYVDGVLFHEANDWYSKKPGFGEVTYPAPFDQPFYLILNLAVGGNWPGNPDITTKFDENAAMYVDYVKMYQKESYNENVTKPEKVVKFAESDATGNFIKNSKMKEEEFGKNYTFLTANGGSGKAYFANNELVIESSKSGSVDYSVQLVQPGLPMVKGTKYTLSFDMYADKPRTAIVAVTAPDQGWQRYLPDTKFDVGTTKKNYKFDFTMKADSDVNGRFEINLGNQGSTATIHITNVRLEKAGEAVVSTDKCLPDGNFVYNGQFQEGKDRLANWTTSVNGGAKVGVTNKNNIREFFVNAPAGTKLEDVKLINKKVECYGNKEYKLTFVARADAPKTIKVAYDGKEFAADLTKENKDYKFVFTTSKDVKDTALTFFLGNAGETYIDNVCVQENALLLNGDFNGGMTGYTVYAYTETDVSYVVDTLNEDSACCIDIKNTGDQDWKIQLKQNDILLEKGKKYKLTFDAKCTEKREIMFALQRDGSSDNNWNPYSGTIHINLTTDFQTFSKEFEMKDTTDPHTILSISMGAVSNKKISHKHTVVIDNIKLEEVQ